MKSKRRHELQHNELAQWLANVGEALKPYQNIIYTMGVLLLVFLAGYAWWSRSASAQTSRAWTELNRGLDNRSLSDLAEVIENHPDTYVARTAAVLTADFRLIEGCGRLFHNKALARGELNKAVYLYESCLRTGKEKSLLERATIGLARAKEALGELNEARRYYGEVATNWPRGAFAAAAKQRLHDLERREIKQLYDDFSRFDPQPAFSKEFDMPQGRPEFDLQQGPAEPSLEYPDFE